MGRKIYGYETKQKYIEAAEERMKEPLKLRRQLVPVFDKMPVRAEGLAQYDDGRGSSQLALFVPRRRHDSVNRSVSRHAG
jgi:hypothetical protein